MPFGVLPPCILQYPQPGCCVRSPANIRHAPFPPLRMYPQRGLVESTRLMFCPTHGRIVSTSTRSRRRRLVLGESSSYIGGEAPDDVVPDDVVDAVDGV